MYLLCFQTFQRMYCLSYEDRLNTAIVAGSSYRLTTAGIDISARQLTWVNSAPVGRSLALSTFAWWKSWRKLETGLGELQECTIVWVLNNVRRYAYVYSIQACYRYKKVQKLFSFIHQHTATVASASSSNLLCSSHSIFVRTLDSVEIWILTAVVVALQVKFKHGHWN